MNDKEFDAVKMMRDIRDKLSMKYAEMKYAAILQKLVLQILKGDPL